jgi:protein phosphatase
VILAIPDPALVVLIGPSGAGKSTFAARHFSPTEIVSSDFCRALVSGDESNIAATPAAFRVLHAIARERLRLGQIVVVDATSVRTVSRRPLIALARKRDRPAVAIAFDLPLELCLQRNRLRAGRMVPDEVVRRQHEQMARSRPGLDREGFDLVYVLASAESADSAVIDREARTEVDSQAWPTASA